MKNEKKYYAVGWKNQEDSWRKWMDMKAGDGKQNAGGGKQKARI